MLDGGIVFGGDADEVAVGLEAWGEGRGEGDESNLGVAGVGVLGGLRDVFGDDELGLEWVVEVEVLEGGAGGASVGGVVWIGDGDGLYGGCFEGG